jgi:hypothetical protein
MTPRSSAGPPYALRRSSLSISGSQHNLKFIELVPLGLGPLSIRDSQKLLQAKTGGSRLRFTHGGIISSFDNGSLPGFDMSDAME